MTAEWVTAWAALGTFVVIAASAGAALIQLRHMRGSNQITVLTEVRETLESPEFQEAVRYVLYDFARAYEYPNERAKMLDHVRLSTDYSQVRMVGNFFETVGSFARNGILDRDLACDLWHVVVMRNWDAMMPLITNTRLVTGNCDLFENFEYLAVLCTRWVARHPRGDYPTKMERMPASDLWPETRALTNIASE